MRPSHCLAIVAVLLLVGCEQQIVKDKLSGRSRTVKLRSSTVNPFGVERLAAHEQAGGKPYLVQLGLAGVSWDREIFRWDQIQPRLNQWNWAEADRIAGWVDKAGVQLLPVLDRCASWARIDPINVVDNPQTQPPNPVHWANYVRQMVGRYKQPIHFWQIWDRPDDPRRFEGTPEDYVRMLRVAYLEARKADPDCIILMGSVTDPAWLDLALGFGAANYCDIIAVDLAPSSPPAAEQQEADAAENGSSLHMASGDTFDEEAELSRALGRVRAFQGVLKRHKVSKPLWVTGAGGVAAPARAQASFLVKLYVSALAGGVDAVFWSTFVSEKDGAVGAGLLYPDLTPRLAAEAYGALADLLADTTARRAVENDDNTLKIFEFEGLDQSVMVVWGRPDSVVELPTVYTQVLDMCGRPRSLSEEEEKTNSITLRGDPIFITTPIDQPPTPAPAVADQKE